MCKKFAEKKGLDWYCWDSIGKYWPEYYQGYSTVYLHMGMSSGKFIVHKLIENIIKGINWLQWLFADFQNIFRFNSKDNAPNQIC